MSSSVRRQLIWVVPALACLTFIVIAIAKSPPSNLELVVTIAISGLGLIVPVAVERSTDTAEAPQGVIRRMPMIASALTTILFLMWAHAWPAPFFDDDPKTYLSGTVRVGVNGSLPGWSAEDGNGFDRALIKFLETEFGFRAELVELNQAQRVDGLTEQSNPLEVGLRWLRGEPEPTSVDLVVNVFSITPDRLIDIDMAGPYYIDRSIVGYRNRGTAPGPVATCVVGGTTSDPLLEKERARPETGVGHVLQRSHLRVCLEDFKEGKVSAIATDWSIIRAFDKNLEVQDRNGHPIPELGPLPPAPSSDETSYDGERQAYGIGLRNNHPRVCKALTNAIDKFLGGPWNKEFNDHLLARGVAVPDGANWHKPSRSELVQCEDEDRALLGWAGSLVGPLGVL